MLPQHPRSHTIRPIPPQGPQPYRTFWTRKYSLTPSVQRACGPEHIRGIRNHEEKSQDIELVADPSIDAPSTRSWMTLENPSSASPALIALLNNQECISNQVSKLTEMVADLKAGPRSRRSSASSRKSGDSDVTNLIENEAADFFIGDEDILTIFGAFVAETGHPLNYGGKFRGAAVDKIKASWDPDTLEEVIARLLSLEDHDVIRLYTGLSAQHRERKAGARERSPGSKPAPSLFRWPSTVRIPLLTVEERRERLQRLLLVAASALTLLPIP
ncbi:uncharacterized protein FPRN_02097 [Fusarium proliferatum]|nr:uncharacterized protein FPRN_02097 [Fusarium proliferatum]